MKQSNLWVNVFLRDYDYNPTSQSISKPILGFHLYYGTRCNDKLLNVGMLYSSNVNFIPYQ